MGFLIALAMFGMVAFGLPAGVMGVAWPSMSDSFGVAVTTLGAVSIAFTVGWTLSGFTTGWILQKTSLGILLAAASVLTVAAYAGYIFLAAWPSWWALLVVVLFSGLGSGFIDNGINVFAAINLNARITNWIHAFFGLGSMAGSAAMTALLVAGMGWQWGYGIVVAPFVVLVFGFAYSHRRWISGTEQTVAAEGESSSQDGASNGNKQANVRDTLRLRAMWMGIGSFAIYTALEIVAGVWSFTLLTEGRGMSVAAAGTWVSAYFAGLFVGRIAIGSVAGRISLSRILRFCAVLSLLGAFAFWQVEVTQLNLVGLVLMGIGLGPIFPTLVSATPMYVGSDHTPNAIGFQGAAAAIGAGLLPAGVGALAATMGLETISVSLVVGSVMLLALLWIFSGGFNEKAARVRE